MSITVDHWDGFEHGILSTAGGGIYGALTAAASSIATTGQKTGARALAIGDTSARSDRVVRLVSGASKRWVSVQLKPNVGGQSDRIFFEMSGTNGSSLEAYVKDAGDDVNYKFGVWNGSADVAQTVGTAPITLGAYQRLVIMWDASANPHKFRWFIDGTEQPTPADVAIASGNVDALICGHHNAYIRGSGGDMYDDWVGGTYTDHANDHTAILAQWYVLGKVADSVGTPNYDAATSQFYFKDISGVETALTTSETTSHQVLDDLPLGADGDHILLRPIVVPGSTSYLDPDGNGTATAWTGTFTNVDDGVREPTAPTDGLTISGGTTDEAAETLTFGTTTWASDKIITLWVYGTGGNKRAVDAAYSVNGSDPGLAHASRAQLIAAGAAAGWVSRTLTIGSQTELDNLRVQFITNTTAGGGGASAPTINAVYVQVTSPDTTTQPTNTWYTEHGFAASGESVDPTAVRAIIALRNDSGTTPNSITAKLRANSNETDIFSGNIASVTTIYKSVVATTAPGGAAWTDSIFDAATIRWGYSSDADSVPRLEGAMLEALFIESTSGPQSVNPSGLTSAGTFGSVGIAVGGVSVSPDSLASAAALGVVIPMNSFTVPGLGSASVFGSPTAVPGGVSRTMAALASAGAFGTPQAIPGPVAVVLVALASAGSFGAPTADSTTRVAVVGLDSAGTFGTPVVLPGAVTREMLALASAGALGSVTAIGGPTTIPVSALASAAALGSPSASAGGGSQSVDVTGLGSAGAFGTPGILAGGTVIAVIALDSAATFGAFGVDGGAGPTFLPAIHGGTHRRSR